MRTNLQLDQLLLRNFKAGLAFTACLLGFLLPARGQDPWLTNTNHPVDTNVSVGASVRLWAYAATAYQPLTYQWQHAGTNLPGAALSYLNLTNLTVADSGGYVAWITNALGGFTNSRTAVMTVDPTFTKITTGAIVTDAEGSLSGNWADYDNDGYVDLFVANSDLNTSVRNTLYHNSGGTNYLNNAATNFTRVSASPFSTDYMRAWSAAWADYDNDGNVDLIAASVDGGTLAQRLYRNNGNATFTAVVDTGLRSDANAATCPWWIDYDNDGFLDLFMTKCNWARTGANDCLFRNIGDGTFKKMSAAEVGPILNDQSQSYECISADYDNDGSQELIILHSNPLGEGIINSTWRCQADGTLVATTPIGIPSDSTYHRSWGDYDNDGWLDAFGRDLAAQPVLFRNLSASGFTNVTDVLDVTMPVTCYFEAWGDYDNDGWLDMFLVGSYEFSTNTINGLFRNNRNGTFTQILSGGPVWDQGRRVVASWTDYNNDGFLDLFIARGDGVPETNLLYRNNGNTNCWLKVKLDGRASNRSGIHARVRARATINGQTFWQMREISCANAFVGQNGLLAHFGLGDATNVTTLRIEWPSGIVQELTNVAPNQSLTVVESQGYIGTQPQLSVETNTISGLQLSITEPVAPARYILEASTDLVQWTKLLARTSTGVITNYTDTRATNYTRRFYRLQVP